MENTDTPALAITLDIELVESSIQCKLVCILAGPFLRVVKSGRMHELLWELGLQSIEGAAHPLTPQP